MYNVYIRFMNHDTTSNNNSQLVFDLSAVPGGAFCVGGFQSFIFIYLGTVSFADEKIHIYPGL